MDRSGAKGEELNELNERQEELKKLKELVILQTKMEQSLSGLGNASADAKRKYETEDFPEFVKNQIGGFGTDPKGWVIRWSHQKPDGKDRSRYFLNDCI